MRLNSFENLYADQLNDLYSAETQLIEALPKMVEAASTPELQGAFSKHLEQTKGHAQIVGLRLGEPQLAARLELQQLALLADEPGAAQIRCGPKVKPAGSRRRLNGARSLGARQGSLLRACGSRAG